MTILISNKSIESSALDATSHKLVATTQVRDWHVGQRLQAVALTTSDRGRVRLQTANSIVDADARVPIIAGQRLLLQVVTMGEKPVLKVLDQSHKLQTNGLGLALRTLLPRQAGLPPLLANITQIALTTTVNQLSSPILQAVKELFKRIPDVRQISTAVGLKQALQDSGIFLEAKFANGLHIADRANLSKDFKAALLKLSHALREDGEPFETNATKANSKQTNPDQYSPPLRGAAPRPQSKVLPSISTRLPLQEVGKVLAYQVEGVLARLQLSQIASASPDQAGAVDWLLELPIRRKDQVDVLAIQIEEHKSKSTGECFAWAATVAFEFEELGPVHAKVAVRAQQVTVDLWAENSATVAVFSKHFRVLNDILRQEGLTVARLDCHHGRMPDPARRDARSVLVSTSV